jgi:hypothetical protein
VGIWLGRTVGVLVGGGEGDAVGVEVAAGVSAAPQPLIVIAMTSINAIPRNETLISTPFSFDRNRYAIVARMLGRIQLGFTQGRGRHEGEENAFMASTTNVESPLQISRM